MDLFDAINKLFRKEEIDNPLSDFMLHRFLASQKEYAPFCKEINLHIKNRKLVWKLWETMLPKAPRAPFLPYAAPKKQRVDDPFVQGLMDNCDIDIFEAMIWAELIELEDKKEKVANYYGIEL